MKAKLLFILTLVCLNVWAQEEKVVKIASLEEAIDHAFNNNLNLTINELQLEKAEMEHSLAKSSRMPQVNGSFVGQKNIELATTQVPGELFNQPGETVPVQFGQEYNYNAGINVSKSLLDIQNRYNIKVKQKDVDITGLDNAIYRESVISQTAYSYYASILADEALQIAHEDLIIADSILQLTVSKFEQGLVDLSVLNRAKINLNRIKQSVDESTLVYEEQVKNLKDVLGIAHSKRVDLKEERSFEKLSIRKENALGANNEILKNKELQTRAELNLKQVRSEYLPKLSLNSYFGSQLFQDEFDFSLNDDGWAPVQYVSLSLNVPLFNGFSTRKKVKIAKIESEVSNLNFEQQKEQEESSDALLLKNYDLTASIVSSSLENYKLHKEIADLEFAKYTEGLVGLEVYLDSFEDYLYAKDGYLNSLTTFYIYYAQVYSRS